LLLLWREKLLLFLTGMFGWDKNSRIVAVIGIEITVVYLNVYLLFRNSENNCYSVVRMK
jgi:high-affinity Fe2+/Pb2+ permease